MQVFIVNKDVKERQYVNIKFFWYFLSNQIMTH